MAYTLSRTAAGIVFIDDFNRADGPPGADYTGANAAILSNKLRLTGVGGGVRQTVTGAGSHPETFAQATFTPSSTGAELGLMVQEGGNYYLAQLFGGVATLYQGSGFTLIAQASFPVSAGTPYVIQLYAKYGEQRFYVNGVQVTSGSHAATPLATGTVAFRSTVNATYADVENLAIGTVRTADVTGLPPGSSVRVKDGGGAVVLGPVAETAGAVSLDFGGVSFPAASVEVIDGSAVVLATFSAADVGPGDVYALTGEPDVPPDTPTVTISAITKHGATLTGSAFSDGNPADALALAEFSIVDADDVVVVGPVTAAALAHTFAGLDPATPGLRGVIRYQDDSAGGLWSDPGESDEWATLPWDEGTEELVIFEAPETPGGAEEVVWASCSSSLDHVRPYLMPPEGYGGAEIDLLKGTASIAQQNVAVLDRRTDAGDQGSGWFSAKLATADGESALIGRRALRRRWIGGEWITVLDGVITGVELQASQVAYRLILKDIRERERKTRAFFRTGTSTVFPRGVFGGYGRLPNGSWLVPPVAPLVGTMKRSTSTIGQVLLDGASPSDPDLRLVYTAAMEEATTPVWDDALQVLVADKVTVLWRAEGSLDPWAELPRMQMPERELWQHKLKPNVLDADDVGISVKVVYKKLVGKKIVTAVRMCGFPLPADDQRVEILVRYDGPASEKYPFHFDGTFGELLRNLYRGDYSTDEEGNPTPPGIRYDEAAVLALDVPCRMRVSEPADNLREWAEKNIFQPLGAAPAIIDGLITPVRYELPPADLDLPVLTRDNCQRAPSWSHTGSDAVNLVRMEYARDYYLGEEGDPTGETSDGDGVASRVVSIEVKDQASYDLMGEKKLEIKAATLRSLGGAHGALLTGDVMDETPARLARDRGAQALDRFRYGGQHITATVSESYGAALVPGSWVIVQLPSLPDYRTGRRSLAPNLVDVTERLAQVVSFDRKSRAWRELDLVDAGAVNQPALAPTLGGATADDDGVVSVPVTAVPAGSTAAVEYAVAASAPASDSGLWISLGTTTSPATLTSPALPAGETVWIRARGTVAGERSSLYTTPVSVTIPSTPRLRDVRAAFADDGTATITFTPNPFALAVRVEYSIQDEFGVELVAGSVDASTAGGSVDLPDLVPADYVLVADVTGWSGWSGSAATGTAGETLRVRERRIVGPWMFSLALSQVGAQLVATIDPNGFVAYWQAWDKVGSSPLVGGVPDDAYGKGEYQPGEPTASWTVKDGTHYVVVRAYSGPDGVEFHELADTIVITGLGAGVGEPPLEVPGTPSITPGADDGIDKDIATEWLNTDTSYSIEIEFFLSGVSQGIEALGPGTGSDVRAYPVGSHVAVHVRYTAGLGLEGEWSATSAVAILRAAP